MTPGEYQGPDRRRGGPDRRAPGLKVKILLVDDHTLFRVGMRQILEAEADFEVVAEADDSRTAIDAAAEYTPDIVLLDLSLPAPGGIETTQRVKREVPSSGIIALAAMEDEDQLFEAIKAGAAAFLLKDISPEDLVTIIRRVNQGEYLINDKVFARPSVANRVLKEFRELAVYGQEAAPIFAPALASRGGDPRQHRQGHDQQAGRLRAVHQRADGQEPHELDPAEALGERPHPGRRVRHEAGMDQDPRGLSEPGQRSGPAPEPFGAGPRSEGPPIRAASGADSVATAKLRAELDADIRRIEGENAEIDMLMEQVLVEIERHEARRAKLESSSRASSRSSRRTWPRSARRAPTSWP